MPIVLGHEAAGTVEEVGSEVTYVKPGDRVIGCLSVFCGHCDRCLGGRPALCRREGVTRTPGDPPRIRKGDSPVTQLLNLGSFAEKMLVHENSLVKVEDDVPFEQMALVGCAVVTGVGAVLNTAEVDPGAKVAVIGCGGVGLNAIQGAVIAGAGRIIAVDTVASKLAMARTFGGTDVVDSTEGDPVQQVMELVEGGVDYSFEAIGTKRTVEQAFEMLASGGTATVIGLVPDGTKVEIDGMSLIGERRLQGSSMGSNRFRIDMPRYLQLYRQGRLNLDDLVSRRLDLGQINEAFDAMRSGEVARSVIVFE
jgi:S-(hydroxymethyl)glutathione dehydrogenase/alcohol dehydrogenase